MRKWGRSVVHGVGLGLAVAVLITWSRIGGSPVDAWCYYSIDPANPYDPTRCFLYAPPVAQLMAVLQPVVSFDTFVLVMRTIEMAALAFLSGPAIGPVLLIPAVEIELNAANINIPVTAAVVLGFRYPWTWAFVILTKLTPGIGLLWFALRREWRNLAIAVGVTVAIVAVSFLTAPWLWGEYLRGLAGAQDESAFKLWMRLPFAVLFVVWGARTNHRWAMIVALFLALPRWYYLSPVVLVGLFPLVRFSRPSPISRLLPTALRRDQTAAGTPTSTGRNERAPSS